MKHTHNISRTVQRAASVAAILGLLLTKAPIAFAASSWNPTLLVNTESFQTIDEGDSTTDVELRFGGTLNEKIFWDYETSRFEFTDDVHVQGNLTATGTIISDGVIKTKSDLTINSDSGDADAILTFGNDGGAETIRFNNTSNNFALSDDLDVTGNVDATGTVSGDGNFTINEDQTGDTNAVLTFGSDDTNETLTFADVADRFEFSDDVYTTGTLEVDGNAQFDGGTLTIGDASGDAVTVNSAGWTFANDTTFALSGGVNGLNIDSNTLSIDATNNRVGIGNAAPGYDLDVTGAVHASVGLSSSGTLVWEGAASGASLWVSRFKGAGLVSTCDPTTGKLTWDSTTQSFVCGTDSGTTYSAGQGLTLTSTVFKLSPSFSGTSLEILGTASGRILHGNDKIQGSGTLIVDGTITTKSDLTINSDSGAADAILTFGNDAGAETLRFNDTTNNFSFSDDIDVTGTVNTTGNITTDADLTINEDNGNAAAVLTFGNDADTASLTFSNDADPTFTLDDTLNVTGNVDATGTISGDGNFTINEDNTAADAVLTFGSDTTTENITFQNSRDRFEFSDDVKTTGYLSGSTLTVDGTVTFRGQAINFPTGTGLSGSVLRTDGAGNLTWSKGINEGSGDILSMHPEFENVLYFQSGSSYIGQLALSGAINSGYESTYQWASTKSTMQDYWMSIRVRIPDNFVRWDPSASLQLRYRTKTSNTAQNHITVKLLDTAGTAVALTGGATLANTAFTTASISGPSSAGTYTPGGYITVLIKAAATSAGQANVGFLNFNWETKTP